MPFFRTTDGINLHYTDEGQGTPVLALAGLTRNGKDFDHVAPKLPCRLIRLDYRGRGQSDWADPTTYTIPQEAQDALALMDHLGIEKAAILGTSRGGLIAMLIAATAKDRLLGVALNDIGPEIADAGMKIIKDYIGRNPVQTSYVEAAQFRAMAWVQFSGVPHDRWMAEVRNHYEETEQGLIIRYDPKLRDAVLAAAEAPTPDLWPFFDALAGKPLCCIRGANSDLLSKATLTEMERRRPDMIVAEVPNRAHIPFLDEPEAVLALRTWLEELL